MYRFVGLAVGLVLASCVGCASVISGTQQEVFITTDPPGALVRVDGQSGVTPAQFSLSRKRTYLVTVEKEGYVKQQRRIGRTVNLITVGNILLGGVGIIIGGGIDLLTGAFWNLEPDDIHIILPKKEPGVSRGKEPAAPGKSVSLFWRMMGRRPRA